MVPSPFHNTGSIIFGICCIVAPIISLVCICTNIAENKTKKLNITTITVHAYVKVDNIPPSYTSCLKQSNYMDWSLHLPSSFSKGWRGNKEKLQIHP